MFKRNLYTWKHSLKNLLPWDPLFSSSLAASWLAGQCESVPQVFTECGSLSPSPDPKLLFTWTRATGSGNESSLPAVSPAHSGTFTSLPYNSSLACQWLQKESHYNGSPSHLEAELQIPAHLPSRSSILWLRSAHPAPHLLQITYPPPTVPPCPSPTPRVHSDSRPSSQWCHPAISSFVVPFSSLDIHVGEKSVNTDLSENQMPFYIWTQNILSLSGFCIFSLFTEFSKMHLLRKLMDMYISFVQNFIKSSLPFWKLASPSLKLCTVFELPI